LLSRRSWIASAFPALAENPRTAAPAGGARIRTGLLSTAHGHLDGKLRAMLESPHYEVVCACEEDSAIRRRRQAQADFRGIRWVSEDELLGDPSLQLVVVETRVVADAVALGRKVIAAGKHLHLEKPPSHRLRPFRELVEEARRRRLLLQMGYLYRFHEGIAAAMEAARRGWLGSVYMLRATINTDLGPPARLPLARYRGGMTFELGCHLIDRAVDLWGRPNKVQSWLRHDLPVEDNLADNTLAVLEYDGGMALIPCSASMPGHPRHRSFELIGTGGTMLVQPIEPGNTLRACLRRAADLTRRDGRIFVSRINPALSTTFANSPAPSSAGNRCGTLTTSNCSYRRPCSGPAVNPPPEARRSAHGGREMEWRRTPPLTFPFYSP
jgi:predicted dehydrogenase